MRLEYWTQTGERNIRDTIKDDYKHFVHKNKRHAFLRASSPNEIRKNTNVPEVCNIFRKLEENCTAGKGSI